MSRKTLLPFQVEGSRFMASRFHAANGDQPGLGKTIQAIHAADLVNARRILVTCPASVRSNWHERVEEHYGHTRGWDVISYDGASNSQFRASHVRDRYDVWIGDEIHFCKTCESQRTRAMFGSFARDGFAGLATRADYKWPMSGTLAPNGRPLELFPMLKALAPAFRSMSFAEYTQKYCGAFFDGRERNIKGSSRTEELSGLLRDFMVRRTKREVFPDRRAPIVSRVPVELSALDLAAVIAAEDEIGGREARLSSSYEKFSAMGDTSRLLRLLGMAMAPHVVRFVDDQLSTVPKVVVFAQHVDVMDAMMAQFSKRGYEPALHRGGMGDAQKDANKARFLGDDKCRVFIGQRQSAGTGIDGLQRVCSTVVDAEPSWVPGETEQRIDRLDRMDAADDIVNAYILYARGTLSAVVVKVHDRKEERGTKLYGDPVTGVWDL